MTLMDQLPVWTSVFFTLAIYSFLYGENPWYRLAEHIYAGVSVGYTVARACVEIVLIDGEIIYKA